MRKRMRVKNYIFCCSVYLILRVKENAMVICRSRHTQHIFGVLCRISYARYGGQKFAICGPHDERFISLFLLLFSFESHSRSISCHYPDLTIHWQRPSTTRQFMNKLFDENMMFSYGYKFLNIHRDEPVKVIVIHTTSRRRAFSFRERSVKKSIDAWRTDFPKQNESKKQINSLTSQREWMYEWKKITWGLNLPFKSFVNCDRVDMIVRLCC